MDALEVQEETGLDFASLNHGCMHACGHDGHTAILLATAKILKKHESELDRRVYLVFQPAEETAEGARFMLKTGVLDSVKRIYGIHILSIRRARFIGRRPKNGSDKLAGSSFIRKIRTCRETT